MKRTLKGIYKGIRSVLVTVLVAVIALFIALYVALLLPSVQQHVKAEGEKALSELLHTQVTIGKVDIKPFNQLVLHDVDVPDQQGDSLLHVETLAAGIDLSTLLRDRRLLFTYGEIIGLKGHVVRPDKDSPTNLQFIIDAFKPKPNQPPKPFDVEVRGVVIRDSELTYDVLDQPHRGVGAFDVNHLRLTNLRADVALPRLRNDDFDIRIKRLAFDEQSGLALKNMTVAAVITDSLMCLDGLDVQLPGSHVRLDELQLSYSSLKNFKNEVMEMPITLKLEQNTITPADLKAFVPGLAAWNEPLNVNAEVTGTPALNDLHVRQLQVSDNARNVDIDVVGHIAGLKTPSELRFAFPRLKVAVEPATLSRISSMLRNLSPQVRNIMGRCGKLAVDADVQGTRNAVMLDGDISTRLGAVAVRGAFADGATKHFKGHVVTPGLQVGSLIGKTDVLGDVALNADVDLTLEGKKIGGTIKGHVDHIDLKGRRLHNIDADMLASMSGDYKGHLSINDATIVADLDGQVRFAANDTHINATADVRRFKPAAWGMKGKMATGDLSLRADADFAGDKLDNATGSLAISDLAYTRPDGPTLRLDHFNIEADNASSPQHINFDSDFFSGNVEGQYSFNTIVPAVKSMLSQAFPQYFAPYSHRGGRPNDLQFNFVLNPTEELQQLFSMPVRVLDKAELNGSIEESSGNMVVNLSAPYLLQGKKIIEGTTLTASLDSTTRTATLHATTLVPSKNGKIAINLDAGGANDRLDANLAWRVMRQQDFHGNLNLSALLQRTAAKGLDAQIDVNPSQLVFNDTVWQVEPGQVTVQNGVINVKRLDGHSDKQWVRIGGVVSKNPDDELCLEVNDVSLDYVFETLNIPNVDFGGRATGKFFASDLLSGAPRLATPGLHVDDLSYNDAVMGDADIQSHWMNEEKAVALRADLAQDNGAHSLIDGAIFVTADSLYLTFDTDHANIAFMKPFMAAFARDVQGEVSGKAILAGNFSTINLEGDVRADSLRFTIGYTGVTYTCAGDSVHIVPDYIKFDNVRIHDRDGHEARMDGWLRHRAFHEPVFEFAITEANDLLCYDTNEAVNPVWYGTIYGDGAAFVSGEPGQVDIKVNMTTAPRSTFTFVLSDALEANDYNFITFRDRNRADAPAETVEQDTLPEVVRQYMARIVQQEQSVPTHYNIFLQGDITPDASLVLVMDPVGGDRVRATGRGSMRMTYNDADEMTVFGTYTLERGNYNFTLQDIIIKDFTIRDGSSITFQGDPYAAVLDLKAVYSLNANLRDLDESFALDKEINRTNVPVHALLQAKGPISQPDIAFDLEFPTLTTDAYRKVKSIISTDEMMNRQIIYLLALNRFYTPDYMNNGAARGNELTSVASSTISSQLSSMLGKMSDKWSISPNFRSVKGDFSDMEVDVALSSQLLNNRLLLNGNFGYRDKTYSNQGSNFIGDFDIEYLLTKRGTLRLKAYNHFNDQNYYVRNALTTQGVGIVWKHDFDRPFDFLRRRPAPTDTLAQPTPNPNPSTNTQND